MSGIDRSALAVCVFVYAIVIVVVPPELGGDTPDYLSIASGLCGAAQLPSFNIMRGFGYPAFECIAGLKLSNLRIIFYVQAAIFLGVLFLVCREFRDTARPLVLLICVAALPHYAYLQDLLFPDGLITSLLLLYVLLLQRRQILVAGLVAALLVAVKLVFVFLLAHLALVLLFDRGIVRRFPISVIVVSASLGVIFLAALPFVLPNLAYITTFVRMGDSPEKVVPSQKLTFSCGGELHEVSSLNFEPTKSVWQFAPYGPLTESEAKAFGCTQKEIAALSRSLLLTSYAYAPVTHAINAVKFFGAAMVGLYLFKHSFWMLTYTLHRMTGDITFGIDWLRVGTFVTNFIHNYAEMTLRVVALLLLVKALRNKLTAVLFDRSFFILGTFLLAYSVVLVASAAVLSDRYVFINLLIFCLAAARANQIRSLSEQHAISVDAQEAARGQVDAGRLQPIAGYKY